MRAQFNTLREALGLQGLVPCLEEGGPRGGAVLYALPIGCLLMCVNMYVCLSQRTVCGSQFSPSATWAPGSLLIGPWQCLRTCTRQGWVSPVPCCLPSVSVGGWGWTWGGSVFQHGCMPTGTSACGPNYLSSGILSPPLLPSPAVPQSSPQLLEPRVGVKDRLVQKVLKYFEKSGLH